MATQIQTVINIVILHIFCCPVWSFFSSLWIIWGSCFRYTWYTLCLCLSRAKYSLWQNAGSVVLVPCLFRPGVCWLPPMCINTCGWLFLLLVQSSGLELENQSCNTYRPLSAEIGFYPKLIKADQSHQNNADEQRELDLNNSDCRACKEATVLFKLFFALHSPIYDAFKWPKKTPE